MARGARPAAAEGPGEGQKPAKSSDKSDPHSSSRSAAGHVGCRPEAMTLDNGLVNLAAIVSTIIVLIGTIPAILLLTTPSSGKK
jgi:hypothetical protein